MIIEHAPSHGLYWCRSNRSHIVERLLFGSVKSVFGTCKRSLGMRRARYFWTTRVEAELHLKFTAYNLQLLDRALREAARA